MSAVPTPHTPSKLDESDMRAAPVALMRAARHAREVARQTGTAVVVVRDGNLVEERDLWPPPPERPGA
jgi:LDH2 family malate/lactate/ureidoglycolate dehydrogenase